jgi:hypothetical protein
MHVGLLDVDEALPSGSAEPTIGPAASLSNCGSEIPWRIGDAGSQGYAIPDNINPINRRF